MNERGADARTAHRCCWGGVQGLDEEGRAGDDADHLARARALRYSAAAVREASHDLEETLAADEAVRFAGYASELREMQKDRERDDSFPCALHAKQRVGVVGKLAITPLDARELLARQ